MIRRGYLRAVTISGRGRGQRLFYEFTRNFSSIPPVLLTRLRRHGVTDGVARGLGQTSTLAVLNNRVDFFESLVRSGPLTPKKSAAALVRLIKNPDPNHADAGPARTKSPAPPRVMAARTPPSARNGRP